MFVETCTSVEINGQLIKEGDEVRVRTANGSSRLRGTWTFKRLTKAPSGNTAVHVWGGTANHEKARSFDAQQIEPVKVKRARHTPS